jgi:FkbM family methyltransferase
MNNIKGMSQLGQEYFVLEMLGNLHNGFFLDSGASNGVRANNTYLLEFAFGWKGICIEPNESFFAELVKNRNCICLNCCLYDHDGSVDYVEASTLGGIINEYHSSHLEYAKRSCNIPTDLNGRPITITKTSRTISSVLKENNAPAVIDYWSLDTEGSEFAILKSFPFSNYSFRVLTVEHNWLPVRDDIRHFLESKGYFLIREMGIDDCYVKKDSMFSNAWRSNVWYRKK